MVAQQSSGPDELSKRRFISALEEYEDTPSNREIGGLVRMNYIKKFMDDLRRLKSEVELAEEGSSKWRESVDKYNRILEHLMMGYDYPIPADLEIDPRYISQEYLDLKTIWIEDGILTIGPFFDRCDIVAHVMVDTVDLSRRIMHLGEVEVVKGAIAKERPWAFMGDEIGGMRPAVGDESLLMHFDGSFRISALGLEYRRFAIIDGKKCVTAFQSDFPYYWENLPIVTVGDDSFVEWEPLRSFMIARRDGTKHI